jgi:hypothetical protein
METVFRNQLVSKNQSLRDNIQGVHFAGLLDVQNILLTDTFISRQTKGYSFGDHPISGSVSVTPSSVTEDSTVLCSESLRLV